MKTKTRKVARLMIARNRLGMTAEELGKRLGKSRLSVERWENLKQRPHLNTAIRLGIIFGMPITDLFEPVEIDATNFCDEAQGL